jgi:signal transduction histidine kinase
MLEPGHDTGVDLSAGTVAALLRLHDQGIRCARGEDPTSLLHHALESVMQLLHADGGWVHVVDPETKRSHVAVNRDCTPDLAALWASGDGAAAGDPLSVREDVLVEDLHAATRCPEPLRRALAGARAVSLQSVSLRARDGEVFGRISTFCRTSRRFTNGERQSATLLARCTADFIRCHLVHRTLEERAVRDYDARTKADIVNRRKDEFLAMVSHELRQPLSAALAAVEVQKHAVSEERRTHAAEVVEQQLRQMLRLVDDLRDATRISQGTIELRRARVDLRLIVQHAIDMTRVRFEGRRHTLEVELRPEPAWMSADEGRMTQVFSNLLQNAAIYTPPDGRIAVSLASEAGHVTFRVRDNGIGIPSEALGRIFDVYERGLQTDDSVGLGIGLAVVRQLVELHGGTVIATSDGRGQGSEFVVTLPAASERVDQSGDVENEILRPTGNG